MLLENRVFFKKKNILQSQKAILGVLVRNVKVFNIKLAAQTETTF